MRGKLTGAFAPIALAAGICLSATTPGWAQSADHRLCNKDNGGSAAIAACSRIIAKGANETRQNLAIVHANRGIEYAAAGDQDRALADYNEAIRLNPKIAYAYNSRGNIYKDRGDLDSALADYNEVIRLDPKYHHAYNGRGNVYRDKGELDLALTDYSEAIRINPKYVYAYNGRGNVHSDRGNLELALADYSEAIRLDPKYAYAYNGRGNVYSDRRELDSALSNYNEAIRFDPKYAYAYKNRGNIYKDKGDLDLALADYNEAIRLDPTYANAYNDRGNVHSDKGNADQALADYNAAIRLNPKLAYAYNGRGNVHADKGNPELALADYNEAIRLAPNYGVAYHGRGLVLRRQGNNDRAMADYNEALRLDPKNANVYYNRGLIYSEKGELSRALADMEAFARLKPRDPDGPAQIQRLRARADLSVPQSPAVSVAAPSPSPSVPAPSVPASFGTRVALVIGNAGYKAQSRLFNPPNDAQDMAAALTGLGFKVQRLDDAGYDAMRRGLQDFADQAQDADMAVVFYAGHGVELAGENYLVPVDASLRSDRDVPFEALPLSRVLDIVRATRSLGLVILDACRNDPFRQQMAMTTGASRSVTRGLSRVEPAGNVLVAYAAREGTTADDGKDRNSPFTRALLKHLATPNLDIRITLGSVRDEVRKMTSNRQEPAIYGTLGGTQIMIAGQKQ